MLSKKLLSMFNRSSRYREVELKAYVDSKSVIDSILSTRMVEDKRLRMNVAANQELLKLHDMN